MTRKQRAAKLAKRKAAQARHRGRVRIEDHGRSKIEVPVGPRPTKSYHRSDPYKHGQSLREAEQIVSFCDRIGFKPTEEQVETMRTLMREGRLTEKAVLAIFDPWERVRQAALEVDPTGTKSSHIEIVNGVTNYATSAPHAPVVHADEVELLEKDRLFDTAAGCPPEDQWAVLNMMAKRRRRGKKGWVSVLTANGYMLDPADADPKQRESWVRA